MITVALLARPLAAAVFTVAPPILDVPHGPSSVVIADLNGDARGDLAVTTDSGTVSVLLGRGDGTFETRRDYAADYAVQVAVADLDSDGILDLVVGGWNGVSWLRGNGDGTFLEPLLTPVAYGAPFIVVRDLNDDGRPDVVTGDDQEGVAVLVGAGGGTLAPPRYYYIYPYFPVAGVGPAAAAGAAALGEVSRAAPRTLKSTWKQGLAVGDFSGDGWPDIVATFLSFVEGGFVQVLNGNGDGTFVMGPAARLPCLWPRGVAMADLDDDGRLDIALALCNWVGVIRGDGSGSLPPAVLHPVAGGAVALSIEDLDGDQVPDLAVSSNFDTLSVLLGDGDGGFRSESEYVSGGYKPSVAIGDLNRDGRLDLAAPNQDSSTVTVLINMATPTDVGPAPTGPLRARVYPNPALTDPTLWFAAPTTGPVLVRVLDLAGRLVATLADGTLPAGEHMTRWNRMTVDGTVAPAGVYFFEVHAAGRELRRTISLLR